MRSIRCSWFDSHKWGPPEREPNGWKHYRFCQRCEKQEYVWQEEVQAWQRLEQHREIQNLERQVGRS